MTTVHLTFHLDADFSTRDVTLAMKEKLNPTARITSKKRSFSVTVDVAEHGGDAEVRKWATYLSGAFQNEAANVERIAAVVSIDKGKPRSVAVPLPEASAR